MLSVVIVEDEKHNQEELKNLLDEIPMHIEVKAEAASKEAALEAISLHQPDLVLMDIELHGGTGFDVLNELPETNFDVIFTTAFEHYALKAIKFSSLDYLLKPIDAEELTQAIAKANRKKDEVLRQKQLELLLSSLDQRQEQRNICLSTAEGVEFVKTSDILYCEASGSYTRFHLSGKQSLLVSKNLKEYASMLEDHDFMRVHNSFLINLREVKRYVKSDGGYILMNDNATISISQKKKDEFLMRMGQLK